TKAERERNCAHQCGQCRHHDWAKTFDACFMNCRSQVPTLIDSLQGEIDNHNSVLFHDAEQEKKSDHAVERQCRSKDTERKQTADNCRDDCRKQDRNRMDITFVKNSEDHVHDEDGGDQQEWQCSKQLAENKRLALERCLNARILVVQLHERILDEFGGVADRDIRQQIEINRDAGE